MRKIKFSNGEIYHIYNRGVDKRNLFVDKYDFQRFLKSMRVFNSVELSGDIRSVDVLHDRTVKKQDNLVEFINFCINPNHYHFTIRQLVDGGISQFIKRLCGGYAWYFNSKHKRTGCLFEGRFNAKHVDSNDYLLRLSAYVNLNYKVHKINLTNPAFQFAKSSWDEYVGDEQDGFCSKDIILGQFKSKGEYKSFAERALRDILSNKEKDEELKELLLE